MYLIYFPLFWGAFLVVLGINIYYLHRYGGIKDNSVLNKYKPSRKNILIKLKLFKYDNNFNYFLLIPYLIAWNLFFVVLILYIIYWCGIVELEWLFASKWLNFLLCVLNLLFMGYSACVDTTTLNDSGCDSPDFVIGNEEKKDEKDKTNE